MATSNEIHLFVDLQSRRLVSGAQNYQQINELILASPTHKEKIRFRVWPLLLNSSFNIDAPFLNADVSSLAFTLRIFKSSDNTLLAEQTSWIPVAGTNSIAGQLNLDTVAMGTAFSGISDPFTPVAAYISMCFVFPDATYSVNFRTWNIYKDMCSVAAPTPIDGVTFLTMNEALALFVKYYGNPAGASVTLISADGLNTDTWSVPNGGSHASDAGS